MSTRPTPLPATASTDPTPAGPDAQSGDGFMRVVANFDIVLTAMAVPVALLLGAPVLGILVGAGVWIVQRLLELWIAKIAKTKEDVRVAVGYNMFAMFGRAWLVGLSILAVGIAAERKDGLAAAVLVFVAFTVYFANSLLARSFERKVPPS